MKISRTFMILAAMIAVICGPARGAIVSMTAADPTGTTSFNAAGKWSDVTAPNAANDYEVGVSFLRTPQDANSYTFAGNSLTLKTGGALLHKGTGAAHTYTINDLRLAGGFVRSGAGTGNPMTLAGNIAVSGSGSGIIPDQTRFIIDSIVSGTGSLTLADSAAAVGGAASGPGRGITFNALNTFTGNLTVSTAAGGGTVFSPTSGWTFDIDASGVNNQILGSGVAAFNGAFNFDLSGASASLGDSWTLVPNLSGKTFGATFSVTGFADQGGGLWSSGGYEFNTATGVLAYVVPEPTSVSILCGLTVFGLCVRRRAC
jgi:hypothetical protein